MSLKLPFKAVFLIDYDQDLINTVQKQVKKYKNEFDNLFKNLSNINDDSIRNSIEIFNENAIVSTILPELFLSLYFLERSFVKATYNCLKDIFSSIDYESILQAIINLEESWNSNNSRLLAIYMLNKEQKDQFLFQLTDTMFQWVDYHIPITRKHEYELFNDSFHKPYYLSSDESILSHLQLNDSKKQLLQDKTTTIDVLHQQIIRNIQENKLSLIIGDYGSFAIKQFCYFLLKDILVLKKQVLAEEIDYFKLQFSDSFAKIGMVFFKFYPSYRNKAQLIELVSSLRNVPAIMIIPERQWDEDNEKDLKETFISNFPRKIEKEYLKQFTTNYLQNSSVKANLFEMQDLIQAITKKSEGVLNYIEFATTNMIQFHEQELTTDYIANLPIGLNHLLASIYKNDFLDKEDNKGLLLTLQGLATISTTFGIISFPKDLILDYITAIQEHLGIQSFQDSIDGLLLHYLSEKIDSLSFKSANIVTVLLEPTVLFDDKLTEDFTTKKLFLTIQEFSSSLPNINFIELFEKTLINKLKLKHEVNFFYYLLILLKITVNLKETLQTIPLGPEEFKDIANNLKKQEANYITNKNLKLSIDYVLKNVESIFDFLLVQGVHDGSNIVLDLLVSCYELVDVEQKIRIHFQIARQFLVSGSFEKSFEELNKSISLIRENKSFWSLGTVLRLMGEIFFMNRQLQFGVYCYDQINQLHTRILHSNSRFKGYSQLKLTDRLLENGLFANALQTIEEASIVFKENNLSLERVSIHQKTADILFKLGSTDLAVKELIEAKKLVHPENKSYIEKLESTKYTMENPELYNPLFTMKNWIKLNYLQKDNLEVQERKYKKIYEDSRSKNVSEELLVSFIQYIRISFKLGKIQEVKQLLDYLEHNLDKNFQNIGLIYLELMLLYNYFGKVDIVNYYSDLTKRTLYNLPVDYEIRSVHQILFIGLQLYTGNLEYADLLIRDHLLRKKVRYEPYLYLFLAYLESKKREPVNFDKLYEKGRSLLLEKKEKVYSKQEVQLYSPALLYDLYQKLFPIVALGKEDVEIIEKIHWLFYNMSIDGSKNSFSDALIKTSTITDLSLKINNLWKIDVQITNNKRIGQIYYGDNGNINNMKKAIHYWQNSLRLINQIVKDTSEKAYLFEKLDLLYLVGSSFAKLQSMPVEEANKYLLSGKNLIRKNAFQDQKRLEFQFDLALGMNFFQAKDYEKARKYYVRALEKHENKVYPELAGLLLNLGKIYLEEKEKGKYLQIFDTYKELIEIFNIKEDLKNLDSDIVSQS